MRHLLQWSLWSIGLALQFLLLSALVSGPKRKYWAVLTYTVVLFTTTIVDILATIDPAHVRGLAADVYWYGEFLRHASIFGVILASAARATPELYRPRATRVLVAMTALFWGASFYFQYSDRLEFWMTNAFRNISFGAAIVNLALWFYLIANKRRETTLLMITGGLGIQMTGEAIGQSLRQLSQQTVLLGGMVAVIAHFVCLYIWWQALRPVRQSPRERQEGSAPTPARTLADPKLSSVEAFPDQPVAVN